MAEPRNDLRARSTFSQQIEEKVEREARRKLRARRKQGCTTWFWLGMLGMIGWSMEIPYPVDVVLGRVHRSPPARPVSWTLTRLILGVTIGTLNAQKWIKQESERD